MKSFLFSWKSRKKCTQKFKDSFPPFLFTLTSLVSSGEQHGVGSSRQQSSHETETELEGETLSSPTWTQQEAFAMNLLCTSCVQLTAKKQRTQQSSYLNLQAYKAATVVF